MKTSLPVILLTLVAITVSTPAKEPFLPPPEMKQEWATLEKKGFHDWKIEKLVDWGGVADGGSLVFEFLTDKDIEFDVLVANPMNYWTEADKKAKRQVIYLIESGRFYLLVPASEQEKQLLRILSKAAATQKGKDSVHPKCIKALIEKIQDRKPRVDDWPMTKKGVDDFNKRAEQAGDPNADDPFE